MSLLIHTHTLTNTHTLTDPLGLCVGDTVAAGTGVHFLRMEDVVEWGTNLEDLHASEVGSEVQGSEVVATQDLPSGVITGNTL